MKHMNSALPYRSRAAQFLDLALHKAIINVAPSDYYHFEFYKPGKTWEEKSRYVAFAGSRYWPFENNEFKYMVTLTNKYIQKQLLSGFDLPTPKVLATIGPAFAIRGQHEFDAFLDKVSVDIALKPISSAGGSDVLVLSKGNDVFQCAGRPYSKDQLWKHVLRRYESGFLVEERVSNSAGIKKISGDCLNTYRVVTIKTNDGVWHVAATSLKVGAPGSVVDNNANGGVQINLSAEGVPYCAYDFATKESVNRLPGTSLAPEDVEFEGFREVNELALTASHKFGFLGTVGWDIAYTDKGPMIIEGNIVWGCSSLQHGRPGIITDALARGLNRHSMLDRWDKARLYPGYERKISRRRNKGKFVIPPGSAPSTDRAP